MARTLIRNGIVLPMTGGASVLDPGSVLVDGNTIVAVGPVDAVDADPRAAADGTEVVDAAGHAVIPGLHNCHLHSGLLRGTAESLALWDWLRTYVDPAHRALTPEIARVAVAVLCRGPPGGNHVGHGHVAVHGRLGGGGRAARHPGHAGAVRGDEDGYDYFESVDSNRALLESVGTNRADGRVRAWVGLEHLLYCTEGCFAAARALAEEFGTGLHTHSSETTWEVEQSLGALGPSAHRPRVEMCATSGSTASVW